MKTDLDRLVELFRLGSKGWCYIRGATIVLIGVLLFVAGFIIRLQTQETREKIRVTISTVQSSHKNVSHAVKGLGFPREEVVPATRVPGTSHEDCTTRSDSSFESNLESCTCSGYSYETEDKTRVECPGHRGRCDVTRNHIVKRTREDGVSSLRCARDDTVACAFELAPLDVETAKSFPLTCSMSAHCQASGTLKVPVATSPPHAPSCPTDKWNTCSMTFMFEGRERSVDVQMGDGCEERVGTVQEVYYNRKKDRFSDRDAPDQTLSTVLMAVGGVLGLFGGMYLFAVTKFEFLCHVDNTRRVFGENGSTTTVVSRQF